MSFNEHITVLLNETIELLNIKSDGVYVDCTFGRGGHSKLILSKLNEKGKLICFDQDHEAIEFAQKLFENKKNVIIIKSNFKNLKQELQKIGIESVDGFIFDLGLSSPQLDNPERGFSYHNDARLDMRMDQTQKLDAHYVVNNYSFGKLCEIFSKYGEVVNPKYVARAIISERNKKEISTTSELVEIIKNNVPVKKLFEQKHPARLFFQAIRIEVNNELNILQKAFEDAISLLNVNGVICVITFHSLEDKITKEVFNKYTKKTLPNEVPISDYINPFSNINKKIKPSKNELVINNRARSSILRAIVRNW